jgi:hypothetical protein
LRDRTLSCRKIKLLRVVPIQRHSPVQATIVIKIATATITITNKLPIQNLERKFVRKWLRRSWITTLKFKNKRLRRI